MIKLLPLLIKAAPILWAFIKEVVLKREDKHYLIRNKFQVFVTILIVLYTVSLYVLHEGYNAHAMESKRKSREIEELVQIIERKNGIIKDLNERNCQFDFYPARVQDMLDERLINGIELRNHIPAK